MRFLLQRVFFAVFLFFTTAAVHAGGLIIVNNDAVTVPRGHHRFAPLEERMHKAHVTITDQVAVTEVEQVFYNTTSQRLEGTYIFPIPKGAQIDRFEMDVNGTMTEAELLDADKARKIYEDIVRSMRDPALMEYADRAMFKVRIFPIEPRSEKRVTLKYTQVLEKDSGMTSLIYPMNTEKYSAAPIDTVSMKVDLKTTAPLQSVYCASHSVEINRPDDHCAVVGFEMKNAKSENDFELFYATAETDAPLGLSVLTYRESENEDGYFLLLASPRADIDEDAVIAKDVVFVVDTSGSMAGAKLDQAKAAMRFCLANLNEEDRFDVVRFSTEAEPLFGGLQKVDDESREKGTTFVDSFKPIGGTAINDALLAAIKPASDESNADRPFMVIFLTDGRPTIGVADKDQIVSSVTSTLGDRAARIFCFGIGTDINTHLLDNIAQKTNATTEYVLPAEDLEVKVSNFYTKVDSPVLANTELSITGPVRVAQRHPGALPDVFKGEQLMVFGRYSGDGAAAISIKGVVNGERQTITSESTFAKRAMEHDFIPRLWATRHIGFLLDQIRLNGETEELRDEVVRLAKQYNVVTPYTSYLIAEDETRRGTFGVARRDAAAAPAMRAAGARYHELQEADSGQGAVDAAKSINVMRQTATASGGQAGQELYYLADEAVAMTNPTKFVDGRTFYLRDGWWIDATLPDNEQSEFTRIEFASDAYFELLAKHPRAAAWFALGDKLRVRIGDTNFEIHN